MELRLKNEPIIDNVRSHSVETVEKLRALLSTGAPVHPDPRRKNFYELENCSKVYYIHLSPKNNKVMLLAVWDKGAGQPAASAENRSALVACCATC